ncbi:helix-turn-helix domain-containing protein [Streptomyces sp. NC-S4]
MADQQLSAPARASSGIRHINHDHRRGYVKIGNHLAQHRELSMTAIGLATHIQSLPTGSKVTIKALAERFPEGEVRIAAALRELETYGYLARLKERLPSGRVVTFTVSYNNPPARLSAEAHRGRREPQPSPEPGPDPDPEPEAGPAAEEVPEEEVPELELQARELLARLRLRDPRLFLSERDTVRLAPAAALWLERGLVPGAVTAALTRALPQTAIHSPAALLAHRLREQLPPRLPDPWGATHPVLPDGEVHPFHACEDCDRAFRSPAPGRCTRCAAAAPAA